MYTPRDYQQDGIDSCIKILTSKTPKKEIVVSPTAGGKSLYVAFSAMNVDFPLIVLQPSKELLEQNYEKFVDIGGEAEIYSSSMNSFNLGKVTFATIKSIKNKVEEVKKLGVKAIIIDEVHLGTQSNSEIRKFIKDVGIKNVLGLTATPVYLKGGYDGAELKMMTKVRGSMFKDITHVTQISELVNKKYWSRLLYITENVNEDFLKLNSNSSDYTLESQKEYYEGNFLESKIIHYVDRLVRDNRKSILIFVPTISDAESLSILIPGSKCVHSKTKDKERKQIIRGFKDLSINVVINVNVLSVGFDHPRLDAIITARSTASIAIYYQQIGRGVRVHPEKKNCRVIDLSGNHNNFGRVEDLNFEYIEGYGWGMFTGNNLLTNYPMAAKVRPTKESLIRGIENKRRKIFEVKRYGTDKNTILWFGKHKGKTLEKVNEEFPQYLPWVMDNFSFEGDRMIELKESIKIILNL